MCTVRSPRSARSVTRGRSSPRSTWARAMFARCEPATTSSPPCASSTGVRQMPTVRPEQNIEWPPRSQSLCHGRQTSPSTESTRFTKSLRGDLGEVLAERVAGAVAVAEQLADREEARIVEQRAQRRRLAREVEDAARVALAGARRRPPRRRRRRARARVDGAREVGVDRVHLRVGEHALQRAGTRLRRGSAPRRRDDRRAGTAGRGRAASRRARAASRRRAGTRRGRRARERSTGSHAQNASFASGSPSTRAPITRPSAVRRSSTRSANASAVERDLQPSRRRHGHGVDRDRPGRRGAASTRRRRRRSRSAAARGAPHRRRRADRCAPFRRATRRPRTPTPRRARMPRPTACGCRRSAGNGSSGGI